MRSVNQYLDSGLISHMSRPPPQPIFVHHGFIGGVTSCAVVEIDDRTAIVVGTGVGKCEVYDAETHMLLRTVYDT
ncbi:unnamed protein product [Cylicostephanus goldi]|uniref:Uncharacterized protein n=1 Tax=Cylicostephanus goldi TaxID=71465 RepID=A0A3P6RTN1_CYLGO|nr:unnamed protein product [Cylicostephanus goldi]